MNGPVQRTHVLFSGGGSQQARSQRIRRCLLKTFLRRARAACHSQQAMNWACTCLVPSLLRRSRASASSRAVNVAMTWTTIAPVAAHTYASPSVAAVATRLLKGDVGRVPFDGSATQRTLQRYTIPACVRVCVRARVRGLRPR